MEKTVEKLLEDYSFFRKTVLERAKLWLEINKEDYKEIGKITVIDFQQNLLKIKIYKDFECELSLKFDAILLDIEEYKFILKKEHEKKQAKKFSECLAMESLLSQAKKILNNKINLN